MIAASDIVQALKLATESEKEEIANVLMPIVEKTHAFEERVTAIVEKVLDSTFEGKLSHSKFQPVQRIFEIETFVGTDGFNSSENEEDENKPSLAKRIQTLEDKISSTDFRPTVNPQIDKIPETKTEIRASLLVDALKASKKDYFSANDIMDFLKCKLPDSCKIDEKVKNVRKVKQDVVKKAEEMFSYLVESNKKTTGHRDIRLVLKS